MDAKIYLNRLDEFRRTRDSTQSFTLRHFYSHAISLSEESMWILSDLVEYGTQAHLDNKEKIDFMLDHKKRELEDIGLKLEKAKHELDTSPDELSKLASLNTIRMISIRLDLDASNIAIATLASQAHIRIKTVPELGRQLFENIYLPNQDSFNFEALVSGINFAIGAVPVLGTIYSGLLTIHGIKASREKRFETADKHMTYLEEYCQSLKLWNTAALSAMSALQLAAED